MSSLQTYLPVPDFEESAKLLSNRHLERQRRDVYTILEVLAGLRDNWRNRPAVAMWRGSELVLFEYGIKMCREWQARGNRDEMEERILSFVQDSMVVGIWTPDNNQEMPWWLGNPGFHLSHKSNLIREEPEHYRRLWPDVSDNLPLVWPDAKRPAAMPAAEEWYAA